MTFRLPLNAERRPTYPHSTPSPAAPVADPAVTPSVTLTSVGIITIAGISTGIPPEVLWPALAGALASLIYWPQGSPVVSAAKVILSTLFSAWTVPVAAKLLESALPSASTIPMEVIKFPAAFGLGFGGLKLLAARVSREEKRVSQEDTTP